MTKPSPPPPESLGLLIEVLGLDDTLRLIEARGGTKLWVPSGINNSSEKLRADLQFLEQHGLIRIEKLPKAMGDLWIAHLLLAGQDVANGRPHAGIAQLQPDD